MRLIASILLEGMYSMVQFLVFPFRRRSERARIRQVILGRGEKAATLLAALLAGPFLGGCSSPRGPTGGGPQPGTSFMKQVDETRASIRDLAGMEDAQGSLEDDLRDLGDGTSFEELRWDLEQIFLSPDAQGSLEDDLRDFGEMEPGALRETFEHLGW